MKQYRVTLEKEGCNERNSIVTKANRTYQKVMNVLILLNRDEGRQDSPMKREDVAPVLRISVHITLL